MGGAKVIQQIKMFNRPPTHPSSHSQRKGRVKLVNRRKNTRKCDGCQQHKISLPANRKVCTKDNIVKALSQKCDVHILTSHVNQDKIKYK